MENNSPVSILVVDDQEAIRNLLEKSLTREGYVCHLAENAEQALEILETRPVDIMLTDIHMPGMTGIELIKKAMAEHDIDTMVMTGFTEDYNYETVIKAGASDFIPKPISLKEINVRIQRVVRERRLRLERNRTKKALKRAVNALKTANMELREAYLDTIHRLVLAAEFKDEDTGDHIIRISRYSVLIAKKLGLPEERIENIRYASPMHDIGKIGIPDSILLKKGRLTEQEFEIMKNHTKIGARILAGAKAPVLRLAREIALTHHEKWDGTGYPAGLYKEKIPISGRIVGLADAFDALTSRRPYKNPYPMDIALKIIRKDRGTHFDPTVVDAFLDCIDEVKAIKKIFSGPRDTPTEAFEWSERDIADRTGEAIIIS